MVVARTSLAAVLCCAALSAHAAAPSRIHGTIVSVTDGAVDLKPDGGGDTPVALPSGARVTLVAPASLGDIKPGDFIGSAAQTGSDGATTALEVHIFAESMRGTGEGHRPFDRGPASTMTNGTVGEEVVGTGGQTLKVRYKDGETTIVVPATTPIVRLTPGDRAALVPGAHVIVFAQKDDAGALTAGNVLVGKDGFVPPM